MTPALREADIRTAEKTLIITIVDLVKKQSVTSCDEAIKTIIEILENPQDSSNYVNGLLLGASRQLDATSDADYKKALTLTLITIFTEILKLPEDEKLQKIEQIHKRPL